MTTVHTSQPKWRPSDPEQEPKNPELYSEQKAWDELQYKSWSGPSSLQPGDWPGYLSHADDFLP